MDLCPIQQYCAFLPLPSVLPHWLPFYSAADFASTSSLSLDGCISNSLLCFFPFNLLSSFSSPFPSLFSEWNKGKSCSHFKWTWRKWRLRLVTGKGVQGKAEEVGKEIWLEKGNRKCPQRGGSSGFQCGVNKQLEEKYFLPSTVE